MSEWRADVSARVPAIEHVAARRGEQMTFDELRPNPDVVHRVGGFVARSRR